MRKRLGFAVRELFSPRSSEFWTVPVNVAAQVLLPHVPAGLQDGLGSALQTLPGNPKAALQAAASSALVYGLCRILSKFAKGPAPVGVASAPVP